MNGVFPRVSVLFACRRSVYHSNDICDVYDEKRDARSFSGSLPVVAHPPCRAWGRYKHRAKTVEGERELAFFALEKVMANGGILEHPACSSFFAEARLPRPGEFDFRSGGQTVVVYQGLYGHRALKPTWLYLVGVSPAYFDSSIPDRPFVSVENMCRAERERTPKPFADLLIQACKDNSI